MSTTDTDVGGTITLTDDELDPYVTHAETRHRLTGPGLPREGSLLGFGVLRDAAPRRVADLVDTIDKLAEELRNQLVIGTVRTYDRDLESIVLDGATGEICTTRLDRVPGLMGLAPLAPSLEALLRFAAATEELAAARGEFASLSGRFGPKAVAEASERLSAVFEKGTEGAVPPYWRMAAVIRPLARIAGPGTGLRLDLPPRLLEEEFGSGEIMRFEEVDFPASLTHEPS
ncbi:MAG: hypothetical protein QOC85_832, partial [Streptomyces sp.]|nr:hypothetical protein [Streptomyces sp.]